MKKNYSNADAATVQPTAITNAQSVAYQVNHFQARGYSELEAYAIAFNLSMHDKEEKKFKEYVEYVSDLTNGFETPNKIAYEKSTDFEIISEWAKFLKEYYPAYEELSETDLVENPNIIKEERIVSEWLEYFAADMRVEIETITTGFGTTSVYAVGYSK